MKMASDAITGAELSGRATLNIGGLSCRLGSRQVLRGVDCGPMHTGDVIAIVGPNGAGKSTLLRCVAGFLSCQADTLSMGSTDLRPLKPANRARLLRYLPQAAPGPLQLTVEECLMVALHAQRVGVRAPREVRLMHVATQLGISDWLDRPVDDLSGGQKQLVWLAQALLHQPQLLLLDEPLAALDPNHQHHVMRLLRHLAHEQGLLVLVVLHDLNIAARYTDQILVLRDGEVIAQGPAAQALTPAVLAHAFRVRARVEACAMGTPLIIIDEPLET